MTESAVPAASTASTQIWIPPEIPGKYEVIPLHTSDRTSFKRCRRYWDWSSPARHNLSLRADVHGVNVPLFFGTGIHYALEQYYQPGLRRDPVEAFQEFFDIQWRGGTVTSEWLDRVYDLAPKPVVEPIGYPTMLWQVRGLEDILPDADPDEWKELRHMGVEMTSFYKTYAERNDNFEIVISEHDFSVPVWDFENNCILKMIDVREQSPNCGKELEVHARGRQDGVWAKPSGKMGILENKTAQVIDENYFEKLETDEQCTMYLWALEVEAQYYDLPFKGQPVEEVIYNTLRKAYPRPPTVLKGGMFSVNRTDESTTYDMLTDWMRKNIPGVQLSEKQQSYVDWLRDLGDEQFIVRKLVRRNRSQLKNAGYRLYLEAMDMLTNPRVYPSIKNDFECLRCQFRAPCLAKEDGGDWEQLIKDNYTRTKDR